MSKGQYLVYERASRDEERLLHETTKAVVNEIEELKSWKKQDPKKQDPKKQDPKKQDPKKQDPKKQDPKKQDPKKQDPKKQDPKKHPGGRNISYGFRTMLFILLLMVYHRKEYREMEAHLNNNLSLLKELGLEKSPGKSTMQRACAKISISTLVRVNDAITAKLKKR